MRALRRFIVYLALGFAFGGFLFYAGVVVPIGTSELGPTTQGFVTRHVTKVINVANLVACALVLIDVWAEWSSRSKVDRVVMLLCCVGIVGLALFLVWFHPMLEVLLDPDELAVQDSERFYARHRVYLWVSTFIWLFSLPLGWKFVNWNPRTDNKLLDSVN